MHPLRRPVNHFIGLKQTSANEEKQNLNWEPLGMFARQMEEYLMKSPHTVFSADLEDKVTLPGNRAFPPGGLIRGLAELRV